MARPAASGGAAEQIPRPYSRAEENARSLYGRFGMTPSRVVYEQLCPAFTSLGGKKRGPSHSDGPLLWTTRERLLFSGQRWFSDGGGFVAAWDLEERGVG